MAARIRAVAAVHPDGSGMLVSVIAPPHEQWPLPWYLRTMPHVGYWTDPTADLALKAPVIVASLDHADALNAALGDRYVSEFYGLRPDVLLSLYVERGAWDRFVAAASATGGR
jgi:predicted membrane-bound mannosyltransferase